MARLLSVVVPTFNEEAVISKFIEVCSGEFENFPNDLNYELIFVDDGSTDESRNIIRQHIALDDRIRLVALSRNFGHQAALTAGLANAKGDAVVSIDCDLQDPPSVILRFIEEWERGADVVLAKRSTRAGETRFKLITARIFYSIMSTLSNSPLSENVGDFRLLSREVVDVLLQMNEASPYYRGLVNWVGFKQVDVLYDRDPRFSGETKYTLRKMLKLASSGITSFSDRPLQMASALGLILMFLSLVGAVLALIAKILEPTRSVAGYASLLLAVLFLGGVQLFSIGVVGLYLSVVNQNTKSRPRYIISKNESSN
jgi:dolichol-phosphate mannosyltransferase